MSLPSNSVKIRACRICLDTRCSTRIKFDLGSKWAELFEFCFGIPITDKNAPLVFCGICSDKLKDYENFKKLCLKSEELWKTILCDVKCLARKCEPLEIKDIQSFEESSFEENDSTYNIEFEENNIVLCGDVENIVIKEEHVETDIKAEEIEIANVNNMPERNHSIKKRQKKICVQEGFTEIVENENKKQYQCIKCNKRYMDKGWILRHVKRCKIMEKCPKVQVPKPSPSIYYCGLCIFTSTESDVMTQHLSEHCLKNDLECKLCNFIARDFADMVTHRYSHYPEGIPRYACTACSKKFYVLLKLQYHYRSVHLNLKGGLCSVCNKAIECYTSYRNHERFHKTEPKYVCDHCGKKFLFRNSIETHIKEHLDVRDYICDTCGKGYKRMSTLKDHINTAHKPVPVTCTHCNQIFKSEVYLKYHLKKVLRQNKYFCPVCGKGFTTHGAMKSHEFFHTGERPHACETCGRNYKTKCQLKIHMRLHSGDKPYRCQHCHKGFACSQTLKRHQSVHTGLRSVKCLYCDRTFHSKAIMIAHCNSRHKSVMPKTDL